MLKLLLYPNDILKTPARRVNLFDQNLRRIAEQMAHIMRNNNGAGLAAPQVGISRRLILISTKGEGGETFEIIPMCNPVIIDESLEMEDGEEGCLSFPGLFLMVKRHKTVKVRYQDLKGKFQTIEPGSFVSRCLQHEINHLDGILFTELASAQGASEILA